jgi:phospholipid/cholesterol/gamma-HCH transport system permease protein
VFTALSDDAPRPLGCDGCWAPPRTSSKRSAPSPRWAAARCSGRFRPPYRVGLAVAQMEFVGVQSLFLVGLVGLFTGMVFAVQTVYGFRRFGAENMVGGVVALTLSREMAPVLTAIMVAARAGSGMAAELGNMRASEQIDALETMAVNPVQYLVVPRILAGW